MTPDALRFAAFALLLSSCDGGGSSSHTASSCGTVPGVPSDASAWFIGPELWDGNHSPGMPRHPRQAEGGSFEFDFPVGVDLPLRTGPKVDYVWFNPPSLSGYSRIVMRYRIDKAPDVQILAVPEVDPANRMPARLTPILQRAGDNWSNSGKYGAYRWQATGHNVPLEAGEHELIVPLSGPGWTSTNDSTTDPNPQAPWVYNSAGFTAAKAEAGCLGFVFGGNEISWGHGARATGQATITVNFRLE